MRRLTVAVLSAAVALAGFSLHVAPASAAGPVYAPPGKYYMALGDSLAWGYQDARLHAEVTANTFNPEDFRTGFADDFGAMLQAVFPETQEINYACEGQSTTDFMQATSCPFPPHSAWTGSTQLGSALAFLQAHPGQVSPIVISLGPDDILQAIGPCGSLTNTECVAPKIPGLVKSVTANLAAILTQLRTAAPTAEIIMGKPYNPFAAVDPSTNALAASLIQIVDGVAAPLGVVTANWYDSFNKATPQPAILCAYTLFCTAAHDIHASDLGYAVMARTVWDASGYQQYTHGFFAVSGTPGAGPATPTPRGQAFVLFGAGKGCAGLVGTSSRDVLTTGLAHIGYVTGNDFGGTTGNVGIMPGTTYSYMVVTLGPGGATLDNNGGSCYSTTT